VELEPLLLEPLPIAAELVGLAPFSVPPTTT
jgi:hypothetical protein